MSKKLCQKWGHNFDSDIKHDYTVLVCKDCGKKEVINSDDKNTINKKMRRLAIQPRQEEAWHECYQKTGKSLVDNF